MKQQPCWPCLRSIAGGFEPPSVPQRLIQEVRRREKVIRIFPNIGSAWRLVGALLAEKHEEWSTGRRYLTMDEFYEWREKQVKEPQKPADERHSESSNRTLQPA